MAASAANSVRALSARTCWRRPASVRPRPPAGRAEPRDSGAADGTSRAAGTSYLPAGVSDLESQFYSAEPFRQLSYPAPIFFSHLQLRERSAITVSPGRPRLVSRRQGGCCSRLASGKLESPFRGGAAGRMSASARTEGTPAGLLLSSWNQMPRMGPEGGEGVAVLRL